MVAANLWWDVSPFFSALSSVCFLSQCFSTKPNPGICHLNLSHAVPMETRNAWCWTNLDKESYFVYRKISCSKVSNTLFFTFLSNICLIQLFLSSLCCQKRVIKSKVCLIDWRAEEVVTSILMVRVNKGGKRSCCLLNVSSCFTLLIRHITNHGTKGGACIFYLPPVHLLKQLFQNI